MKKILFVCTGNICRSPMAEGILREKLKKLRVPAELDSCGFESFHAGDHPDNRAVATLKKHGIDISSHSARLFTIRDLKYFDHIYVMDASHYNKIMRIISDDQDRKKVDFIMNAVSPGSNTPVPDPWYDDLTAFEHVYYLLDDACESIANRMANQTQNP